MSVYGNAILLGGGGGGLDLSKAIIHVVAPTGSTLTFTLNSATIGTLSPGDSIVNNGDANYSDYFFPVSQSNYGTITVSASPTISSKSVTVDSAKVYDIYAINQLYLYRAGTLDDRFTRSTGTQSCSVTYEESRIRLAGSSNSIQAGFVVWNDVDLSSFNNIYLTRSHSSGNNNRYSGIFITQNSTVNTALAASINNRVSVANGTTSSTISLNISSYSGRWRVGAGFDTNNSSWSGARTEYINNLWLE